MTTIAPPSTATSLRMMHDVLLPSSVSLYRQQQSQQEQQDDRTTTCMEMDGNISPCCWLLSIPVHCGFCPYQTGQLVSLYVIYLLYTFTHSLYHTEIFFTVLQLDKEESYTSRYYIMWTKRTHHIVRIVN